MFFQRVDAATAVVTGSELAKTVTSPEVGLQAAPSTDERNVRFASDVDVVGSSVDRLENLSFAAKSAAEAAADTAAIQGDKRGDTAAAASLHG